MKITKSGHSFHEFKKTANVGTFPKDFTDYIKSYGEIYFWEKGNFHIITKARDAREILKSDAFTADRGAFFISRMPNLDLSLVQDFFGVVKKMMVMSDDQDHLNKRKLANIGFEDHIIEKFKSKIKSSVKILVSDAQKLQDFDFVETISKKLPAIVLADLFSIPDGDRELFYQWSNTMTGFFGGASQYRNEDGIEVNHAAKSLKEYFYTLIDKRQKNPGDDYVSMIIANSHRFDLTQDEIVSQLIMMLVAGMSSTTDQLNNNMFQIATNSSIQNKLRENSSLIPKALEELNRFDPAVTFIFRLARADTVINNQPIKKGDVIFISTHAINRDEDEFDRPDEIQIERGGMNYAYGYGAHYCIGAKLAREEMKVLFEEIFTHWPEFSIDSKKDSIRDHYSLSFSGFKNLHISL